jgi:hypothetical protein
MLQNEMDAIYSSIKPEDQREITKIFVQDILHCKSKEFYKRKLILKEDRRETKSHKKANEMEAKINSYIQKKKFENNESNKKEFIDQVKYKKEECSRTCPMKINRNQQLKLNIIKNEVGPLDRSVADSNNNNNNNKNNSSSNNHNNNGDKEKDRSKRRKINDNDNGLNERINNIKEHLNIVTPLPPKLYERVKVLEDKIIKIEHDYPTWASVHFNQPNKNLNEMNKLT